MANNNRLRGIRNPVASGMILGRLGKGVGDVQPIALNDLAKALAGQPSAGGGGLDAISDKEIVANISGGTAIPVGNTLSAIFDDILSSTRGSMLVRGASGWSIVTAAAAANDVLSTDASADPSWGTLSALLDSVFSNSRGSILYRGASAWAALPEGSSGQALFSVSSGDPIWSANGLLPPAGNPPTIVQVATQVAASATVTFSNPPATGNLLVAFVFNNTSGTPGTGYTSLASNTGGTDFAFIATKTAGTSEPAAQVVISSTPTSGAAIVIYELSGANTMLGAQMGAQTTGAISNASPSFPALSGVLGLVGIEIVSSTLTFASVFNTVQDALVDTGVRTRGIYGGHNVTQSALTQAFAQFSANATAKSGVIIFGR